MKLFLLLYFYTYLYFIYLPKHMCIFFAFTYKMFLDNSQIYKENH